jgi:hypothetical protein
MMVWEVIDMGFLMDEDVGEQGDLIMKPFLE